MYRVRGFLLALLIACSVPAWSTNESQAPRAPRLILQITVDQLRGDMLPRYRERFSTGGFRRLMEQGVWYSNAHYGTSNTFTAAGHAVLATGADTAEHGMAGNEWFDRASGKPMYCTADPRHPILGELRKLGAGMSPANLTATTFGDELVNASGGRARVFAVAGKDRSSIIPGGHLGKAYWYSEETGGFVTSSYYHPQLPEWVARWNQRGSVQKYRTRPWTLSRDAASYHYAAAANNRHARANKFVGQRFPHVLDDAGGAEFYGALRFTPMLDEHTAEFARELLTQEKLGQQESGMATTDYLSISFSATDYVGHTYGPNSVEYEDNLIRLDTTLAALLEFIDRQIGAGSTLVVLSADHGVDDIPEQQSEHHLEAGRLAGQAAVRDGANAFLRKRLNVGANVVAEYVPPGIYLDRAAIVAAHLDAATVETALAEYARSLPGVAYALSRTDLIRGAVARTPLMDRIERGFHPERSGDVVIIQDPFWYVDSKPDRYAATHGSPYSYDTYVPVIFYGAGIQARTISRNVEPASIAPTLAALLRIQPPSGTVAPVLAEVLDDR